MTYFANATLDAAVTAEIAALATLEPTPVAPFGYGVDISCAEDLDDLASEVDINSPLAVAQAIVRRWLTDAGTLIDDPDYGLYAGKFLNRGTPVAHLASIAGRLELEALEDDRVESCSVSVSFGSGYRTMFVKASIIPEDASVDDFAFTFGLTSDGAATLALMRTEV
jgi:hypothetical protein